MSDARRKAEAELNHGLRDAGETLAILKASRRIGWAILDLADAVRTAAARRADRDEGER